MSEDMERTAAPKYDGMVESDRITGEASFIIEKEMLITENLFDQQEILYSDVQSMKFENYSVFVCAENSMLRAFRMGQACEWFYRELLEAYNQKVLTVMNEEGNASFETKGTCVYDGEQVQAVFRIIGNSLLILPPDKRARRIPFVFINGMKKDNYALTVSLSTGEKYTFSMLGRDLEPMEKRIADGVKSLREKNISFIKKLDDALGSGTAVKAGRLFTEGIASPVNKLPPELIKTLEKKINNSKIAKVREPLYQMCDEGQMYLGMKELPEEETELLKQQLLEKLNANAEESVELTPEQEDSLRWNMWAVLPAGNGEKAVAEFAFPSEDAATYIFRTEGDFDRFMTVFNRAMDAAQMERKLLTLSDMQLEQEQNADAKMLLERTPAIQMLRHWFVGKAIHRSVDGWKKSVLTYIE